MGKNGKFLTIVNKQAIAETYLNILECFEDLRLLLTEELHRKFRSFLSFYGALLF